MTHCVCGKDSKCVQCGLEMRCHVTRPCIKGESVVKRSPGLGDYVESVLSKIGITPELVTRITGRPCGCAKRKAALNRIGRHITG